MQGIHPMRVRVWRLRHDVAASGRHSGAYAQGKSTPIITTRMESHQVANVNRFESPFTVRSSVARRVWTAIEFFQTRLATLLRMATLPI